MRITQDHIDQLYSAEVVDQDGSSVGNVGQVYLDDQTGEPAWLTVKTGFFGTKETFVPLAGADLDNGRVRVPFEKSYIKDAPNMDADGHISEAEQDELDRYYGGRGTGQMTQDHDVETVARDRELDRELQLGDDAVMGTTAGTTAGRGARDDADYATDYSTDRTDVGTRDVDRDDADRMTLHEERVDVGTERVQTGRVRLRKHVVTEQETVTVPVQREEFEIVREPVTDGGGADRSDLGDDEIDVAVHEERPVIDKEVVATEQVGVDRRVVTDERDVTTDVSREEVDVVEDDTDTGRRI